MNWGRTHLKAKAIWALLILSSLVVAATAGANWG